ncbi:MAG: acyl-CoA thioesterase [Thermoanaerobaculia bacterium]|nr:acyl-CoA thioesterase [Thermoanaerobaculia bacterium]
MTRTGQGEGTGSLLGSYPVAVTFPVHWNEMDALGHVNNTRYFVWFESARMALFEALELDLTGSPRVGPILAHTECSFRRPVTYPSRLIVATRIGRIGTSSFTMNYCAVEESAPELPVAEGSGVIVLYDYEAHAKVEIPESLRRELEALKS